MRERPCHQLQGRSACSREHWGPSCLAFSPFALIAVSPSVASPDTFFSLMYFSTICFQTVLPPPCKHSLDLIAASFRSDSGISAFGPHLSCRLRSPFSDCELRHLLRDVSSQVPQIKFVQSEVFIFPPTVHHFFSLGSFLSYCHLIFLVS